MGYSDKEMGGRVSQTYQWETSTTGGTHSLAGVSGSTNMCSHANFAAEVAYMKFDTQQGTAVTHILESRGQASSADSKYSKAK